MDHPLIYRLWQAPFAERKVAPFLQRIASGRPRRVLDVGCGPGTNARHFLDCEYLGVDVNPAYVRSATAKYGSRFRVADVTQDNFSGGERWDCVLVNSLLHHLPDEAVDGMLRRFPGMLTETGVVHVLELVLPERRSLARGLARLDRGQFPRTVSRWKELLTRYLKQQDFEEYEVGAAGIPFWKMLYFAGTRP